MQDILDNSLLVVNCTWIFAPLVNRVAFVLVKKSLNIQHQFKTSKSVRLFWVARFPGFSGQEVPEELLEWAIHNG